MNGLMAIMKLTRIEHSILLVIAVVAAELIVGGLPTPNVLALSLASPALISMGAFAINDYFDVETDRANKRLGRPIVAGAISKRRAYLIAMGCLVVGVTLSAFINIPVFCVALVFGMLAYLYSKTLKDMLLIGNVYVALTMVIPFIYGDLVVSTTINAGIVLISMMIFLVGLGREIHGMIRDRVGDDRVRRAKSLVRHIGAGNSAVVAIVLYIEGILISIYLLLYIAPFIENLVYLVPIAVADLIFGYVAIGYLTNSRRVFFDTARNLSLVAMGLALAAFLFSAIYYVAI